MIEANSMDLRSGKGRCSVYISGADHFPRGITWYVEWLPKGCGPTSDDVFVCAFHDAGGKWWDAGYRLKAGARPPVIDAAVRAIEEYMRAEFERIPGPNHQASG